jgi:hypothetical protein
MDFSPEESDVSESSSESTELPATFKSSTEMSGSRATTGAGAITGAGATTGAGAAAAEVITAVFFDAAGLSTPSSSWSQTHGRKMERRDYPRLHCCASLTDEKKQQASCN